MQISRRRFASCGWMLLGGAFALVVWVGLHPGGGRASARPPTVVDGFLSAVQTPAPGEFPNVGVAVHYLVEQVRTQNLAAVTRVLPIRQLYQRETFRWQVERLQSFDLNSFLPRQPLSRLLSVAGGTLTRNYSDFSRSLLDPQFASVVVVPDAQAALRLEARLDPRRLSGFSLYARSK